MSAFWTEEREGQVKTLWLQGLSASQIARRIGGVTRSAVLGKVHRLQLPKRVQHHNGADTDRAKRAKRVNRQRAAIAKPKYKPPVFTPAPARGAPPQRTEFSIPFIEANAMQCQMFCEGEDGALGLVCGKTASINRYCSDCARIAYQPKEKAA